MLENWNYINKKRTSQEWNGVESTNKYVTANAEEEEQLASPSVASSSQTISRGRRINQQLHTPACQHQSMSTHKERERERERKRDFSERLV
jgi:biotin-(acetyl-CoA carboxylase) ligase